MAHKKVVGCVFSLDQRADDIMAASKAHSGVVSQGNSAREATAKKEQSEQR